MLTDDDQTYVSLGRAASDLGVPMSWLKAQADADEVPHLKCGRMRRFNIAEVERLLRDRAEIDPTRSEAPP